MSLGFDEVCRLQPGFGFRIYRTRAGFRLLVTSGTFDPSAAETLALLKEFGSDPLYIRLCKAQECFRARLWQLLTYARLVPGNGGSRSVSGSQQFPASGA